MKLDGIKTLTPADVALLEGVLGIFMILSLQERKENENTLLSNFSLLVPSLSSSTNLISTMMLTFEKCWGSIIFIEED